MTFRSMHANDSHPKFPQYAYINLLSGVIAHLRLLVRLEWKMLAIIAAYAVAIGLFMLGVPIAVQELVSTFSFAVEPRMIATLSLMVAVTLVFVAAFRVLQARAVETLNQRVYTRVALAFTQTLPRLHDDGFLPQHAHRFLEAELSTRALVAMVGDLFNVVVVSAIGMTMLVLYHPYFLFYNSALIAGFAVLLALFGRGGFRVTLDMSHLNYEIFNWIQDIARNLPHLRAAADIRYLLHKTDELTHALVRIRQRRSDTLTGRQYKAAALWLAFGHAGLIATAGSLVAYGQITVGQFAAAEIIVGDLLMNMDTLARRMVPFFFLAVSFRELAAFFSLPHEQEIGALRVPVMNKWADGIQIVCRNVSYAYPDASPLFREWDVTVKPGEKVAVLCQNSTTKTALAKVLAGLYRPTTGVVRYNDVNLAEVSLESINEYRGLVLDSLPTVLDSTVEENITLGRRAVSYEDIQWALRFAELDEEVAALPLGLKTRLSQSGHTFTLSQILRLLVARAVVRRPRVLIFDGTLHSMLPATRENILRKLCSHEMPWSVIFVSNDPSIAKFVDRHVLVHEYSAGQG